MYLIIVLFFSSIAVGDAMRKATPSSSKNGPSGGLNAPPNEKNDQTLKAEVVAALKKMEDQDDPDSMEYGYMAISWPEGHYETDKDCLAIPVDTNEKVWLIRTSCADKLRLKGNGTMAIQLRHMPFAHPVLKVYQGYKLSSILIYAFLEIAKNVALDTNPNYHYSTVYTQYSDTEKPSF